MIPCSSIIIDIRLEQVSLAFRELYYAIIEPSYNDISHRSDMLRNVQL